MNPGHIRHPLYLPVLLLNSSVALFLLLAVPSYGADVGFEYAERQYQQGDYRAATSTLLALPAKTAASYALMGKAYYMDGENSKAATYLEKAVKEAPRNSDYYDWLGRAYGRQAEEASFLTALSYARKTRQAFERAYTLDPNNLEALGDLFEFYLQAPGIVGGGVDKAEGVALAIKRLNQSEYHYVRARLAEKRKNLTEVEQELRTAMELAPDQVGRVLDVATFLYRQGRYVEGEDLFAKAAQMAPDAPKLFFARASVYINTGRNLEKAKELLRRYAELPVSADDPSRSEVKRLLAKASR